MSQIPRTTIHKVVVGEPREAGKNEQHAQDAKLNAKRKSLKRSLLLSQCLAPLRVPNPRIDEDKQIEDENRRQITIERLIPRSGYNRL
jgi:hypothetical protein